MKTVNPQKLKQNIETRMMSDFENNNINAAALIVKQEGKSIYKRNFGLADNTSVFRMASMTKPITAVAIMTLFDKGLLNLDDLVEKYLPEFSDLYLAQVISDSEVIKKQPIKNKPTIKHLLTHTSGILNGRSGGIYAAKMTSEDDRTLKNAVRFYSECALAFEPFSMQEYSATAAFDVLARIVEVISGKDYNEYLKENIFIPCNMKDTTFTPTKNQWERVIPMHNKCNGQSCEGETAQNCIFERTPVSHYLGGAGLISTLEDYSNFAEMLLNNGEFDGNRVLSKRAVELISTPHVPEEIMKERERWGLGVRVITKENYKLPVGTFGWSGAYGTHFWVDKENKITAVYLKNSRFDGGSGAVTSENFEMDVFNSLE